jgi:MOSC domain-containing protein YiiM
MSGLVVAVSSSGWHGFSKPTRDSIHLLAGLGVEGDAHAGTTVKHRSRVKRDPTQPNLRQVHLIHEELHQELQEAGFRVGAGTMGENVTTRGVDLLGLPRGTLLHLGPSAVIEVKGLRNPCLQLDRYQPGLMAAVLGRDDDGVLVRRAGIMAIVHRAGSVRAGDRVEVELPTSPFQRLEPV